MSSEPRDVHRVTLPSGVWANGTRRRDVGLRPLTVADEARLLLDDSEHHLPAHRVSELLGRCLTSLEAEDVPDPRALTVGDREALLLHFRRLTTGEDLACVVVCPEPSCTRP